MFYINEKERHFRLRNVLQCEGSLSKAFLNSEVNISCYFSVQSQKASTFIFPKCKRAKRYKSILLQLKIWSEAFPSKKPLHFLYFAV